MVYRKYCVECKDIPKIGKYIGETCRSIEERSREHVDKYEIKNNDSVLYQHMLDKHNGELRSVKIELVKRYPGDAMLRQVSESVYTQTSRIHGRETPVYREKLSGADHFNLTYFQIELIF